MTVNSFLERETIEKLDDCSVDVGAFPRPPEISKEQAGKNSGDGIHRSAGKAGHPSSPL